MCQVPLDRAQKMAQKTLNTCGNPLETSLFFFCGVKYGVFDHFLAKKGHFGVKIGNFYPKNGQKRPILNREKNSEVSSG